MPEPEGVEPLPGSVRFVLEASLFVAEGVKEVVGGLTAFIGVVVAPTLTSLVCELAPMLEPVDEPVLEPVLVPVLLEPMLLVLVPRLELTPVRGVSGGRAGAIRRGAKRAGSSRS